MQPSGQPRLVPNGGSPIRPGPLICGIILAFASIAFPPLLLLVLPGAIAWGIAKWSSAAQRRREHRAQLEAYQRYYAQWQADQASVINPGWRL